MAVKATLINDVGNKVVVDSGSQQAQDYFSQGYTLMGANDNIPPTPAPANDGNFGTYTGNPLGPNATTLPSVIGQGTNPVQDTTANQAGVANVTAAAQTAEETALAQSQTDLAATLKAIQDQVANAGTNTQAEIDQINAAGTQAGSQYDPLIEQARSDKTKGEGKAVVGAGRRGGFMRLRDVGVGAVEPTQGGTWFGAGGRLEDLKSAYERNINQLEVAKVNAIAAAKSAKETAIRTGKKEDIQMALDMYKVASDAASEAQRLYNEKLDRIAAGNKAERDAMESDRKFALDVANFEVGQDRFERTQSVAEGWLNRSLTQDEMKTSQDNIINMANSRIPLDQISEEKRTELEASAGYEPGSFEAIYSNALEDTKYGDKMDELKMQQLQTSISKAQRSGSGGGNKAVTLKPGEDMNTDVETIADRIYKTEQSLGGKGIAPEAYWSYVDELAGTWGISREDADSLIISNINQKKGVTNNTQDVSDFEEKTAEEEFSSIYNDLKDSGIYTSEQARALTKNKLRKMGYSNKEVLSASNSWGDKFALLLGVN